MRALTLFVAFALQIQIANAEDWDPCKEAERTGSYNAIRACGGLEREKVDAEIEVIYKKLLVHPGLNSNQRRNVARAQATWHSYRDQWCSSWEEVVQYNATWCRFGAAKARLEEMTHLYKCLEEGASEC